MSSGWRTNEEYGCESSPKWMDVGRNLGVMPKSSLEGISSLSRSRSRECVCVCVRVLFLRKPHGYIAFRGS
ncbi:uncharacterized protein G2W53_010426 [Senna tora]|uniref:Uncharacterized protein n=1 Tax=Senna tora TaxID=362788 RepID=A0A834WZL5_9FABA|nr:uncharacterized protein G2W53_010426 [Senna tora]